MTDRVPYCHKIRYGISGAPILTENEMDGSHAPGVGVRPTLIELVYIPARYDSAARVDASVTGLWTRFGEPDSFDGQVTVHFKSGPSGWPAWLAEEARLHDPECAPAVDRSALRDHIADALVSWTYRGQEPDPETGLLETIRANAYSRADAALAVLPEPADRAAVLSDAADFFHGLHLTGTTITPQEAEAELRRLAAEARNAVPSPRVAQLTEMLTGREPEPTPLRWGLDDIEYGDDDTVTVMLSGPGGEPYWLELDPERAGVLREALAGPEGETAEAHEPRHRWYVELLDADEWMPASGFHADRDRTTEQLRLANERHPKFSDGTPVQRRLVRETTTYTVETEHAPEQS